MTTYHSHVHYHHQLDGTYIEHEHGHHHGDDLIGDPDSYDHKHQMHARGPGHHDRREHDGEVD